MITVCCREYTGYMALHIADTGPPGAAWAFTPEWRLQQVRESRGIIRSHYYCR